MTIYTIDAPPAPSDFELETMDRVAREQRAYTEVKISFPDFCTICLDLHEGEPSTRCG